MKFTGITLSALLAFGLMLAPVAAQDAPQTPAEICEATGEVETSETTTYAEPASVLESGVDYRAILCTGAGAVYVDLFEELTPITVNSFIFLSEEGFYNNTTFHRVIEEFMAQAGDPTATGSGGPGYAFADEFVPFLTFDTPGWLAMANSGPGTNGSQFFITTAETPWLDSRHTIFGQVLEGEDNVLNIALRDPETAIEPGTTLDTVIIISDPETVETTYVAPESSSREDIEAAFASVSEAVPPEIIVVDEDVSGVFDTADVVASAPEDIQDDLAAYFERHNHLFRAVSRLNAPACGGEEQPFFQSVSYTLDAYDTAEDASAALEDEELSTFVMADGFTDSIIPDGYNTPLYTASAEACGTEDGTRALLQWQRGRYVVTVEGLLPSNAPADPDLILTDFVGSQVYERLFASILRREIG